MSTRIKKTEHVRSLLCSFYVIVCGRTNIQHVTMAGKTKDMSQIKQLLLLKKEGVSNRKAAEIVGINKETANNYVRKALADRLGIDGLLKLDDPVLEHRLKGGNPAYTVQGTASIPPGGDEAQARDAEAPVGGIRGGASRRPLQPHPVPLSLQPEHRGEEGVSIDRSGGHAHGRREALP